MRVKTPFVITITLIMAFASACGDDADSVEAPRSNPDAGETSAPINDAGNTPGSTSDLGETPNSPEDAGDTSAPTRKDAGDTSGPTNDAGDTSGSMDDAGGTTDTADGGGEALGPFESGFDDERQLIDLSEQEVSQYCDAQAAYLDDRIGNEELNRLGCTVLGVATAAFETLSGSVTDQRLQTTCSRARDECLRSGGQDFTCSLDSIVPTCMATVAQAETCLNQQILLFETEVSAIVCEELTLAQLEEVSERTDEETPECAAVEACEPPRG